MPVIPGVGEGVKVLEGVGVMGVSDGVRVKVGSGVRLGTGVAVKRGVILTMGASVSVGMPADCWVSCPLVQAANNNSPAKNSLLIVFNTISHKLTFPTRLAINGLIRKSFG